MSSRRDLSEHAKELRKLDPTSTLSRLSSYLLVGENSEKSPFIEFAIRMTAGLCEGNDIPSPSSLDNLLQSIGWMFRSYYAGKQVSSLQMSFMNEALFVNRIEGNIDQAIASVWRNFEKHDRIIERRAGFNVANAIYFAETILSEVAHRMQITKPQRVVKISKEQYYDFSFYVPPTKRIVTAWSKAIQFTEDELVSLFPPNLHDKVKKFIEFVSVEATDLKEIFDPLESQELFERPLIRVKQGYLLPMPYYVMHGLSTRFHNLLRNDLEYKGSYKNARGRPLEEWASEEFRLIFYPERKVFKNTKYSHKGSRFEADVIVSYKEYLIFVECTTKTITPDSKKGDQKAIIYTLERSITKCYLQAVRAKEAFLAGEMRLELTTTPSKFFTVVVTDTTYPNLMAEYVLAKRNGTTSYLTELIMGNDYPYIICIFDLESLRHICDADTFMKFLTERISMYQNPYFIAHDELDYFILFSKPEYKEMKEKTIERRVILNYVAHLPSPATKPLTFRLILQIIGSDSFAIIKIGKRKYGRELASTALGTLYDIYNAWDAVMEHLVFDAAGFNKVVSIDKTKGVKCRVIAWEGMYQYFRFYRNSRREKSDIQLLNRGIRNGSIGNLVNVIIAFPTDIYQNILKRFASEFKLRNRSSLGNGESANRAASAR